MLLYAGISLLAAVAFLALTLWAKRGKRLDRHPVCRACRYDLYGTDLEALPDCPECGATIASDKDFRDGNRRPRKALAYAAGLLCALGLLASLTAAGLWAKDYDWNRIKPVSWLIDEAADPSSTLKLEAAVIEIERRYKAGLLSDEQVKELVRAALDYQADDTKVWLDFWGEWIQRARTSRHATREQWQQYVSKATQLDLRIREKIRVEEPFVRTDLDYPRIERGHIGLVDLALRFDDIFQINEQKATFKIRKIIPGQASGPVIRSFTETLGFSMFIRQYDSEYENSLNLTEPGNYELEVTTRWVWPDPGSTSEPTVQTDPITITKPFEVFPANEQVIRPVKDEAFFESATTNIKNAIDIGYTAKIIRHSVTGRFFLKFKIPLGDIPHYYSFDVEVYINGKKLENDLEIMSPPRERGTAYGPLATKVELPVWLDDDEKQPTPPDIDTYTLRLVPNPEHLKRTLDGYDYLDHIIEIKDIPIAPYEPNE